MDLKFIYAVSTLACTIIGVGLFSLPYITLKVGFPLILAYFLILGFLVILIHQLFGEVSLKTPDLKRLPGFVQYHLGERWKNFAFLISIISLSGAILAYLIVGGEFLNELFSHYFSSNTLMWTIFYFVLGAVLIFFGIRSISRVEFWGLILFLLILLIFFLKVKGVINPSNLFIKDYPSEKIDIFLPYGPILFSLWGASLIPEVEEILKEKKYILNKVIIISLLIPILVYLFFIYLILGISGPSTTEYALVGLKNFVGEDISKLLLFFGFLTTFTSFIALGLQLKKIFWYDLKLNKNLAFLLTVFPPILLFLLGVKQFLPLISFLGAIMIGLEGILILLMYKKISQSKIKITLSYLCFLVLFFGLVYEVFYFLNK